MKLPRRKFLHLTAGAAALPAVPRFAFAQAYPTRPVRLIVGAPQEADSICGRRTAPRRVRTRSPSMEHIRPACIPTISRPSTARCCSVAQALAASRVCG
jgi:hypothetical protein